ncbi:bifunctional histidinol-phosphatase/imidazoleglycerol-phosphate dehydratase HisB [Alistipes sp.]|uniref:bifunctional histidinol-phosphatase/imidazoleglycerol-phosphate dehydratase HisB n=1 Tax=Alistipes sp. TaxID=1872444 RepID=UPI0025BFEC76|nr:bifunctional histidinol-phosphatase/imidazoleglycerol-phosphate dehydratase HisB [Alistipes sp.]MCI7139506.1 bifunctional histidinol-phosphatase/imidazoleglycerol-phosphate dehydratase HisB [Alistipes sp.]MDY5397495.1 bifunctional histidinol-phosphatase/imidazoleglycerol-phosphate dehydratase HisB [Alistipes sp.]
MKKALFIDRDGTILAEPADEQIDSLEKMEFVPGAISALKAIAGLGYELVLATNQDGLGTETFPEEQFLPPHEKMLATLRGEGVVFDDQLIDRTFERDGAPTRKPRTGMFTRYMDSSYDLAASFVIGDRMTDIELARNLGARGILLAPDTAEGLRRVREAGLTEACAFVAARWEEIAEYLRRGERRVEIRRETRETQIVVRLDLDGHGNFNGQISTGLRFLDHMLQQIAHHGGVALAVEAHGDLDIDEHHTVEDVAITLGEAIDRALGSKAGIARYGFALPMDDCRALVLLDFGGRIDFEWEARFRRERIGDVPTELFRHFFHALCSAARCNLQIAARGENEHHKAEAIFKAFARALRMAVARQGFGYDIPSSKGVL